MAVAERAEEVAAKPWVAKAARLGYATRGLLYAVVGALALALAFGRGGDTTGTQGAIAWLAGTPLGRPLLVLVGVGLAGFVLWRLVETFLAPVERDATAWVKRGGRLVSAVLHATLLVATVKLLRGRPVADGEAAAPAMTARLLDAPFGRALVATAGVAVVAFGLREIGRAMRGSFERRLALDEVGERQADRVRALARFGLSARGVVFALAGGFLVQAALAADPSRAKGLGGTLGTLAERPFGAALLAVAAAGLLAYAAWGFVEARYRRLDRR